MNLTTPHAALMFAYNAAPVCKISRYFADLRQSHAPRAEGAQLTPWDRVAQAAMIKAFVERLPGSQAAHIMARYGPRANRSAAYLVLTAHVMSTGHELTNQHLVRELVARWYGKKADRLAAKKAGVHRSTLYLQNQKVRGILGRVADEAEGAVGEYLGLDAER
jgi:hypothetical protein